MNFTVKCACWKKIGTKGKDFKKKKMGKQKL
uniref:Uncharacterized protein n=1 Tax=Romanomermis culicivorax TaxID=13658 RepID=A0A915JRV4_ROMCU